MTTPRNYKFRFYKHNGFWMCLMPLKQGLGVGDTPKKAYDNACSMVSADHIRRLSHLNPFL